VPLDLQFPWPASGLHAVRSYSWISLPRTSWRRIRAVATSVTGAVMLSPPSDGRRFLGRCGRCRLVRDILIQDPPQVPQPGDQHPAGDLGPGCTHPVGLP
jgi:hypothetical protein